MPPNGEKMEKNQVQRKCKRCGVVFLAKPGCDRSYCSECSRDIKRETVLRERVCATCGNTFLGYPHSKYCPTCKRAAMLEAHRRSNERQKNGTTRKLGSTDICQSCGAAYTVVSGLQRYCPECAKTVVQDNIRNHKRNTCGKIEPKRGSRNKKGEVCAGYALYAERRLTPKRVRTFVRRNAKRYETANFKKEQI